MERWVSSSCEVSCPSCSCVFMVWRGGSVAHVRSPVLLVVVFASFSQFSYTYLEDSGTQHMTLTINSVLAKSILSSHSRYMCVATMLASLRLNRCNYMSRIASVPGLPRTRILARFNSAGVEHFKVGEGLGANVFFFFIFIASTKGE